MDDISLDNICIDNLSVVTHAYDTMAEFEEFGSSITEDERTVFEKFLQQISGTRVIDLGCGHGRVANYILEKKQVQVIGYDISSRTIINAKLRNKHPANITYYVSDMQIITTDELFDAAIISFSLIHLTHNQAVATFENLYKILSCNALVYISLLKGETDGYRQDPLDVSVITYVKLYSEEEIKTIISACGFLIQEIFYGEDNEPAAFSKDSLFIIAKRND